MQHGLARRLFNGRRQRQRRGSANSTDLRVFLTSNNVFVGSGEPADLHSTPTRKKTRVEDESPWPNQCGNLCACVARRAWRDLIWRTRLGLGMQWM